MTPARHDRPGKQAGDATHPLKMQGRMATAKPMTHDPSSSLIPRVIASAVGVRRPTCTAVEYGPRVTAGSPSGSLEAPCSSAIPDL